MALHSPRQSSHLAREPARPYCATTWLVLFALIAAACGGSGVGPTSTATQPEPSAAPTAPEPTATPVSKTEDDEGAPDTGSPDVATPLPQVGTTSVQSVLTTTGDAASWVLPAGGWSTDVYSSPLQWTTTRTFVVDQQARGLTVLRDPDHPESPIVIIEPSFVASLTGGGPPTQTLDVDALRDGAATEVRAEGSIPIDNGDVLWADFVVDSEVVGEPWDCGYISAAQCTSGMSTPGFDVFLPVDVVIRIASPAGLDFPVLVFTLGDATSAGDLSDELLAIAASLRTVDSTDATDDMTEPVSFVAALGNRADSLPPGNYVASIGDATVIMLIEADLPQWTMSFSGFDTIGFTSTSPLLSFYMSEATGFVPADAEQVSPPDFPAHLLDDVPPDFDAWVRSMVAVVDNGETEIGGQRAHWWDTAVDDTVAHSPCGIERWNDPLAKCVTMYANELAYGRNSGSAGRLYWFPEASIFLQIDAQEETLTTQELAERIAPLLEAMVIVAD